jgi:hypothetical protein
MHCDSGFDARATVGVAPMTTSHHPEVLIASGTSAVPSSAECFAKSGIGVVKRHLPPSSYD